MKNKSAELSRVKDMLDESEGQEEVHLYFVTRQLKRDIKSSARVMQRYDFILHRIEINNDVKQMLLSVITERLSELDNDMNIELAEYEAVVDDESRVYTYQLKNKAMSFASVLREQLPKGGTLSVRNVSEFLSQNKPWAFCVDVLFGGSDRIVSFTKIGQSRVAVDERNNPERKFLSKVIRTRFDVDSSLLELIEGDTINLDKRMDCLYDFKKDQFFVFSKSNFEKIVGIEEEFKEVAEVVIKDLKNSRVIDGLESLSDELDNDPGLHRKLYKLKKSPDYKALDSKRLSRMKLVAKSFKLKLNSKGGKLLVESRDDFDLVIKLLDDYFVQSEQTGNKYGASVKKKWVL